MSEPLDLNAISDKWLRQCPSCDAGLLNGCVCPQGDHRPVILSLVREVERLRRVGICGNALSVNVGPEVPSLVCDLPAGHDGWHGADNVPPLGALYPARSRCSWSFDAQGAIVSVGNAPSDVERERDEARAELDLHRRFFDGVQELIAAAGAWRAPYVDVIGPANERLFQRRESRLIRAVDAMPSWRVDDGRLAEVVVPPPVETGGDA